MKRMLSRATSLILAFVILGTIFPQQIKAATYIPPIYTVTFNSMGGSPVSPVQAREQTPILPPTKPVYPGYVFVGWYVNSSYTLPWNFSANLVLANMTLYARWLKTPVAGFVAKATGYNSIALTWQASAGANGYKIERYNPSTATYSLIKTLTGVTSYSITGLTTNVAYYYRIRAFATIGSTTVYSGYSGAGAKPTLAIPPSFTGFSASYVSIKLTWGGVTGASGFQIYRATSSTGTYSLIKSMSYTARYYINSGLTSGKLYYYKIRAYRLIGTKKVYGAFSAVKAIRPAIPPIQSKFISLRKTNSQTTGWITIAGTVINYPVVKGTDNKFYMNHNFYRQYSAAGTIFLDYRNSILPGSPVGRNLILYGHNMKNGTMFQNLMRYKNSTFFYNHRTVRFDTLYKNIEWKIFAAYVTSTSFAYTRTSFSSNTDYLSFIRKCQAKSKFKTTVVLTANSQILTLSTCTYEFSGAHFVVQAVRTTP
jgi:SrtB family sortase